MIKAYYIAYYKASIPTEKKNMAVPSALSFTGLIAILVAFITS